MSFIQGKEQTILIIDELNENTPYINAHTMLYTYTYEVAREDLPL